MITYHKEVKREAVYISCLHLIDGKLDVGEILINMDEYLPSGLPRY